MHDTELTDLLVCARHAQSRFDTARPELSFETRMQAVLRTTAQDFGPARLFQTWLRAAAGLAAVTGILAFFVLAGRETRDTDDALNAWWTGNSAAWDLQLFD